MEYHHMAEPKLKMNMYEYAAHVANLVDVIRLARRQPESEDASTLFGKVVGEIFTDYGEDTLQHLLEDAEVADRVRIGGDN